MQIKYSIKDLERLSGIKAHTIRIWEQRYHLLAPDRGGRNIRSYSNNELKKLLNVNFLNQCGYKISDIAALTDEELKEKLSSITKNNFNESSDYINMLIIAMIEVDEDKFNQVVSDCVSKHGFEYCVDKIIFPFLRKIGIMWIAGDVNPAQEHFISHLIRQKIIVQIDILKSPSSEMACKHILYLPEGEWHELSLLYYTYLIKKTGVRYLYLGQSVPFDDIKIIVEQVKPKTIITIITTPLLEVSLSEYITKVAQLIPNGKLLISGFQIHKEKISLSENVNTFSDSKDFYSFIEDNQ
ncbi:MAG: MerR family transcriptional regulator [Cytophagales bacterium]|nr:MAG: MerR family transcriptional regulator [Cytophagales bacterium]